MGSVSGSLVTLNLLFSPPGVNRNSGFQSLPKFLALRSSCSTKMLDCFGTELRRLRQAGADPPSAEFSWRGAT